MPTERSDSWILVGAQTWKMVALEIVRLPAPTTTLAMTNAVFLSPEQKAFLTPAEGNDKAYVSISGMVYVAR